MSHGSALGAIANALDGWPKKTSKKFKGLDPRSDEAYHKLVSYVLEIARKLEYVYLATRPFALEVDPALAARIKGDNARLEKYTDNWRAYAEEAETILIELIGKTHDDHDKILDLAAAPPSLR